MKVFTLQSAVAIAEMAIGLILVGLAIYFLLSVLQCKPEAAYCASLGMYAALLSLVPGCVVAAAGAISKASKRYPFWLIQSAMIGVNIAYFAGLFVWLTSAASG